MKYISYNLDFKDRSFSTIPAHATKFSDQQILELQDLFLTNGFHEIIVPSLSEGRSLIYTFLDALRCFETVGCVTSYGKTLRADIIDLKGILNEENDSFFCEGFNLDFIWIEHEPENVSFEQKILEFKLDDYLPIVIIRKE